ncbi:hypothetical protein NMR79_003931 [Vibrio vulnificus]|nr:hypothetical protein [Vibrio vulnificus]WMO23923.1 hypothetical protein NI374_06670 [Vibrio parahaemolyticus]
MVRTRLIQLVFVMSLVNFHLDHSGLEFSAINVAGFIFIGVLSVAPAAISKYVAARKDFELRGVQIYQLAADAILGISVVFFSAVLFVIPRPESYPGASHMYVVTWPVLIGALSLVLYFICSIIHKVTNFKSET